MLLQLHSQLIREISVYLSMCILIIIIDCTFDVAILVSHNTVFAECDFALHLGLFIKGSLINHAWMITRAAT